MGVPWDGSGTPTSPRAHSAGVCTAAGPRRMMSGVSEVEGRRVFRVSSADATVVLIVLSLMTPLAPLAIVQVGVPGVVYTAMLGWFWWTALAKVPVRVEVGDDGSLLLVAKLRQRRLHIDDVVSLAFNRSEQITVKAGGSTLIKVADGHELVDLLCEQRPALAATLSSRSLRELERVRPARVRVPRANIGGCNR